MAGDCDFKYFYTPQTNLAPGASLYGYVNFIMVPPNLLFRQIWATITVNAVNFHGGITVDNITGNKCDLVGTIVGNERFRVPMFATFLNAGQTYSGWTPGSFSGVATEIDGPKVVLSTGFAGSPIAGKTFEIMTEIDQLAFDCNLPTLTTITWTAFIGCISTRMPPRPYHKHSFAIEDL